MTMMRQRPEPPYRQIALHLRARILAGDLKSGEKLPSIRQITERWNVAIATATKAVGVLRAEGLVESKVGSGTVVAPHTNTSSPIPHPANPRQRLHLTQLLRTAISIADVEGLEAVSMRRVATELGVGPMSLYRHVASRDELVAQMVDTVFGEVDLPDPAPSEWRANLELIARSQWDLCRRHLWLPKAVSFTRPLLVPRMAAHTEWTLRSLEGLNLSPTLKIQEALTLHSVVIAAAMPLADEIEAEQETGIPLELWRIAQRHQSRKLLAENQLPQLAAVPEKAVSDLGGLFEYSLARHLDGLATLLRTTTDPTSRS